MTMMAADLLGAIDLGDDAALADPSLATAWSADGFTPLHLAAFFGGGALACRALLGAGAGATTDDGRTPADMARAAGHETLADRLLP